MLRSAPAVNCGNLVDAGDRAVWRAGFFRKELAANVGYGILFQGCARIAALLRAVMYQPVFANVEVSRARAATPVVGFSLGDVVLEAVDAGKTALFQALHLVINTLLLAIERLQLAGTVMNNSDGGAEAEFQRTFPDGQRILRIFYAAADHGIDVDVEVGILGKHLQLLIQDLQTFLRNVIGRHVINGNLQPFEARAVKPLNALGNQQISVGDHAGDHAVLANAGDDVIQFRMEQW